MFCEGTSNGQFGRLFAIVPNIFESKSAVESAKNRHAGLKFAFNRSHLACVLAGRLRRMGRLLAALRQGGIDHGLCLFDDASQVVVAEKALGIDLVNIFGT